MNVRHRKSAFDAIESDKDLDELKQKAQTTTLAELACFYGCSYDKMWKICKVNGIKPLSGHNGRTTNNERILDKNFAEEHTLQEIANYYNISLAYTRNLCKKQGVKYLSKAPTIATWALTYNRGRVRSVYYSMLRRCYNSKCSDYKNYGARGITVCKEWKENCCNFYQWAKDSGYAEGLTLDRIDTDKNYCPDNCRWITRREQNLNQRRTLWVTYKGVRKQVSYWAEEYGIPRQVLVDRIFRNKWDLERAFTEKVHER